MPPFYHRIHRIVHQVSENIPVEEALDVAGPETIPIKCTKLPLGSFAQRGGEYAILYLIFFPLQGILRDGTGGEA